jgi:hypothetical protein
VSSFRRLRRQGTLCPVTLLVASLAGCASMPPRRGVAEIEKATRARGLITPTWAVGAMPSTAEQVPIRVETASSQRAHRPRIKAAQAEGEMPVDHSKMAIHSSGRKQ